MLNLTINIHGKHTNDLLEQLIEVRKQISKGDVFEDCIEENDNKLSGYRFEINGSEHESYEGKSKSRKKKQTSRK